MPRPIPPKEHQFPANRPHAPHTQKGPYLTPILKKILNKTMKVTDPEVHKLFATKFKELPLKKLVMLRYVLNAVQGENQAIEGIMERLDGKVKDKTEHSLDDDLKGLLVKALKRLE